MSKFLPLSLLSLSFAAVAAAQEEIAVTPRIESVGVFKNGVAVVRASFPVERPGLLRWDRVPQVMHGTFQVENEGELAVRTTMQAVEETDDKELPNGTLQDDLAGKQVEVTLRASSDSPGQVLRGTVWDLPERTRKKRWDTDFTPLDPWGRFIRTQPQPEQTVTTGAFLVLERADGTRDYLNSGTIQSLKVTGPFKPKTRKVEKPVMLFDARKIPAGGRITISYLTKGLAWTPAYRVDLSDPAKLSIRQTAVIRNELMDLHETEVQLISGFPNMTFEHVDSPLSPDGSLAGFFQQLAQRPGSANGVQTQMISYNSVAPNQISAPTTNPTEKGNDGDDMHFESIGTRTLAAGDSLALEIAASTAGYQRVVEWIIEDDRDEDGRYHRNNEQKSDDLEPWDAVKFANPLKFPMTTAPATLVEGGKFRGQSMGKWVNPGQQVCLRITKALSVPTQYAEVEEEKQREVTRFGGRDYYRTTVKGTITLRNTRGKTAVLNVRKQFSGEMIEATDKPRATLRTEGVRSINPRRELEWDLELPAGQEKEITFRYSVLVPS